MSIPWDIVPSLVSPHRDFLFSPIYIPLLQLSTRPDLANKLISRQSNFHQISLFLVYLFPHPLFCYNYQDDIKFCLEEVSYLFVFILVILVYLTHLGCLGCEIYPVTLCNFYFPLLLGYSNSYFLLSWCFEDGVVQFIWPVIINEWSLR